VGQQHGEHLIRAPYQAAGASQQVVVGEVIERICRR
jgi:hypothetical protein